jgi:hypothetical protein
MVDADEKGVLGAVFDASHRLDAKPDALRRKLKILRLY